MGLGGADVPDNIDIGPRQGAYSAMETGGHFKPVLPQDDVVVAHKVDIDNGGPLPGRMSLPSDMTRSAPGVIEAKRAGQCP